MYHEECAMLTANKRAYCELARKYQESHNRYTKRCIDNQMRELEESDADVNVLAMTLNDRELIDLLLADDRDASRVTRALLTFLCDKVCEHDEFFDIEGAEYPVGTCIAETDITATIDLGNATFEVTIIKREG
jgi:hypothetical protein